MSTLADTVDDHRDDLEALAESDLPSAWLAEALLETAEANGGGR